MSNSVSHEIAKSLRNDILRSRYRAGDRLPSERDLATAFETSRGAVRESYTQLEQGGLIKILPGGARVQPLEEASLSVLGPLLELNDLPDPVLVEQFFETMGAMVELTAKSAVKKADEEQLNQLRSMVVKLASDTRDYESMQPELRAFLKLMADISDNLIVTLIRNDLRAQFLESLMNLGIKPEIGKKSAAKMFNEMILSIDSRDPQRAAAAIEVHFDDLRVAAIQALESSIASDERKVG